MHETLNIDVHLRELIINTLNKSATQKEASETLRCSIGSLYRYIKHYQIVRANKQWQ